MGTGKGEHERITRADVMLVRERLADDHRIGPQELAEHRSRGGAGEKGPRLVALRDVGVDAAECGGHALIANFVVAHLVHRSDAWQAGEPLRNIGGHLGMAVRRGRDGRTEIEIGT